MFKKIVHWSGIVFSAVLGGLHKAETKLDADLPAIEKLMSEGATVAQFLPGPIGPEVTTALNLGVELLGAADKTLHYTDDEFTKAKAQVEAALSPDSGYSVILLSAQLKADVTEWLTKFKEQADAVKADAQAVTGNKGAPAAAKALAAKSVK